MKSDPKRDWSLGSDRRVGKNLFRRELLTNKQLLNDCHDNPDLARKEFARIGNFDLEETTQGEPKKAIPRDAQFRVFPEDVAVREKMVVLVIRDPNGQKDTLDDDQVWQCTYFPY